MHLSARTQHRNAGLDFAVVISRRSGSPSDFVVRAVDHVTSGCCSDHRGNTEWSPGGDRPPLDEFRELPNSLGALWLSRWIGSRSSWVRYWSPALSLKNRLRPVYRSIGTAFPLSSSTPWSSRTAHIASKSIRGGIAKLNIQTPFRQTIGRKADEPEDARRSAVFEGTGSFGSGDQPGCPRSGQFGPAGEPRGPGRHAHR